jgi:hypothetical protein
MAKKEEIFILNFVGMDFCVSFLFYLMGYALGLG